MKNRTSNRARSGTSDKTKSAVGNKSKNKGGRRKKTIDFYSHLSQLLTSVYKTDYMT